MNEYLLKGILIIVGVAFVCAGILLFLFWIYLGISKKIEQEEKDIYEKNLNDAYYNIKSLGNTRRENK